MPPIVDAHHHLWDRSMTQFDHKWHEDKGHEKICKNFLPPDLEPLIKAKGVEKTVFVQTQHDTRENDWVLDLACLLYTSPSPRDQRGSRMPSSA